MVFFPKKVESYGTLYLTVRSRHSVVSFLIHSVAVSSKQIELHLPLTHRLVKLRNLTEEMLSLSVGANELVRTENQIKQLIHG